jgi:hypothetical protein
MDFTKFNLDAAHREMMARRALSQPSGNNSSGAIAKTFCTPDDSSSSGDFVSPSATYPLPWGGSCYGSSSTYWEGACYSFSSTYLPGSCGGGSCGVTSGGFGNETGIGPGQTSPF